MSKLRRTGLAQANSNSGLIPLDGPNVSPFAGLKKRWPLYAVAVFVGVLAFAWIDGGEEPIHPISQAVEIDSAGMETT